MITPSQEYFNNLWHIDSLNPPHLAILIPSNENIYNIDLNSRIIESPDFISVAEDHRSEIIYFKVNRYYEAIDMADTSCLIQYSNKTTKKNGIYVVPFYDLITCYDDDDPKILFPWCIDGLATEKAGILEYSIKFFQVADNKKIVYNLNTLPAQSKILNGLNPLNNQKPENPDATSLEDLVSKVDRLSKDYELYWEIIQ